MKYSAVTGAYSSLGNDLIAECQKTNSLETLDSIEAEFKGIHAMFVRIMTHCTDEEIVKMRRVKENAFTAFDKARKDAFIRLTKI